MAVMVKDFGGGSGGMESFSMIGSTHDANYTFTADAENVLICGISGRSGNAQSEITTTATIDARGYWQTAGTQGSLALLYCKEVSAGDTVSFKSKYGYPSIFVIQLG